MGIKKTTTMNKYRIKKEAVPFILEEHATRVYELKTWNSLGIDERALEEVKPAYVTCGHRVSDISSTLGGWENGKGAYFEFTIHFPSVSFYEHDKFSKGRITRALMDKIQHQISDFYEQFLDEKQEEQE